MYDPCNPRVGCSDPGKLILYGSETVLARDEPLEPSDPSYLRFLTRPISLVLLLLSVISMSIALVQMRKGERGVST